MSNLYGLKADLENKIREAKEKINQWQTVKIKLEKIYESLMTLSTKFNDIGEMYKTAFTLGGKPVDLAINTVECGEKYKMAATNINYLSDDVTREIAELNNEIESLTGQLRNVEYQIQLAESSKRETKNETKSDDKPKRGRSR